MTNDLLINVRTPDLLFFLVDVGLLLCSEVVLRNGESGSHSTFDNTALNGVRLLCTGGSEAKSSEGSKGTL